MLVRELVQEKETQKKTGTRRTKTLVYYLYNETSQQREQVCKHMLLNTLDIGEWSAANWARRLDNNNNNEGEDSDEPLPESRVSREKFVLQEFFDALPKLESHYCRKDTSKLYLEHNWQSMSQLYREYQSFCKKMLREKSQCGPSGTSFSIIIYLFSRHAKISATSAMPIRKIMWRKVHILLILNGKIWPDKRKKTIKKTPTTQ